MRVLIIWAVLSGVISVLVYGLLWVPRNLEAQAFAFTMANYWPVLRLPLFVVGMLAGLLRVTDDAAFRPCGTVQQLCTRVAPAVPTATVCLRCYRQRS
jgi:peptidoglycan/LPS O-acetylase OafA/YrhL